MKTGRVVLALLALGSALGVPRAGAAQRLGESAESVTQALLDAHNRARDEVGVPRLAWSGKLAREARSWAEVLAREGRLRHSTQEVSKGAGENLWMGSAGYYAPAAMIGAFVDEKRHYLHGAFPQVSRTGRWQDVGHYTQVVWRDTREVGCAVVRNRRDDVLVCRYWPAGNWLGQVPF